MPVNGILAKKIGMTTVFADGGEAVPVTVLEAGPCTIVQVRTRARDGYEAAQLAFQELAPSAKRGGKARRGEPGRRGRGEASKPALGHFKKANIEPHRVLAEFGLTAGAVEVGARVSVTDLFKVGERVTVRGRSKGKGFQGVMKRWNFKGQKDSHGQKIHRKPASQGATAAARVFKGSRRPGHMGDASVTVANLQVVNVVPERNLLLVRGAVPGPTGSVLRIEVS